MEFHEWEPVYRKILADFGFDRAADERARDRLSALLAGADTLDLDGFSFEGAAVAIAGAGPNLADELDVAVDADAVVAASSAAAVLDDAGVPMDLVVTDLDGDPERALDLANGGTAVAVHAHGDNVPALERYVPRFAADAVVPTTQAEPVAPTVNAGGFTDGDRAAFIADHCGADSLVFPGWQFDDPTLGPVKARKLRWAQRLLYWLERRRDERFSVLHGRRSGLADDVPVE